MVPGNFSDYYKTISNAELLDILDNPENYQPLALKAAKEEFEKRHLSEEKIHEAKELLSTIQAEKEGQNKMLKDAGRKVKSAGNALAETFNPMQPQTLSVDILIRWLSISFSGLFIYHVLSDFRMFSAMIKDTVYFDTITFFYFFPFVVQLLAIITFWKRKTVGWMLLVFFIIYVTIGCVWLFFEALSWEPSGTAFDHLLFRNSPVLYLIQIILLAATLYVISKKNIREVYKIDEQRLAATFLISVLITIFFMLV